MATSSQLLHNIYCRSMWQRKENITEGQKVHYGNTVQALVSLGTQNLGDNVKKKFA